VDVVFIGDKQVYCIARFPSRVEKEVKPSHNNKKTMCCCPSYDASVDFPLVG
jgi:hypothetical protein